MAQPLARAAGGWPQGDDRGVIRRGGSDDRPLLVHCMTQALGELGSPPRPQQVAALVDLHWQEDTPRWWAYGRRRSEPLGVLWLGNAWDSAQGDRYGYVLLLYVEPAYRRRGIATALLQRGEGWARARGDRQLGLQVHQHNAAAIALYQRQGYQTTALWMTKMLDS